MARKKKIKQEYYVYYDFLTRNLLSVTNEKHQIYENYITINIDDYDKLVSGLYSFNDFRVDYIADNILGLVSVVNDTLAFNNTINRFITIPNVEKSDQEFLVEWHNPSKHWIFSISKKCKNKIIPSYIPSKLEFFIILESDYDLLIRTIVIDTPKLISETIYIPFENTYEYDILSISIATKSVFKSYRLDIINE